MSDQGVIQLHHLTRKFGELVAVNDVSFSVARGAIYGLLGPNGSGKSTIIRMLCGVLAPSGGVARGIGARIPPRTEEITSQNASMSPNIRPYTPLPWRPNIALFPRHFR